MENWRTNKGIIWHQKILTKQKNSRRFSARFASLCDDFYVPLIFSRHSCLFWQKFCLHNWSCLRARGEWCSSVVNWKFYACHSIVNLTTRRGGQSERSNKKYEKSQSSQQMLSIPKHLISKKIPLSLLKKNVIGSSFANLFSGQLIFWGVWCNHWFWNFNRFLLHTLVSHNSFFKVSKLHLTPWIFCSL